MKTPTTLTTRDAKRCVRALGEYQTLLESAFLSELPPGEREPRDPAKRPLVEMLRKHWREAEELVSILTGEKPSVARTAPSRQTAHQSQKQKATL